MFICMLNFIYFVIQSLFLFVFTYSFGSCPFLIIIFLICLSLFCNILITLHFSKNYFSTVFVKPLVAPFLCLYSHYCSCRFQYWAFNIIPSFFISFSCFNAVDSLYSSSTSGSFIALIFWRTLTTSTQLGRKCQWTVWMECGTNFSQNICRGKSFPHHWD